MHSIDTQSVLRDFLPDTVSPEPEQLHHEETLQWGGGRNRKKVSRDDPDARPVKHDFKEGPEVRPQVCICQNESLWQPCMTPFGSIRSPPQAGQQFPDKTLVTVSFVDQSDDPSTAYEYICFVNSQLSLQRESKTDPHASTACRPVQTMHCIDTDAYAISLTIAALSTSTEQEGTTISQPKRFLELPGNTLTIYHSKRGGGWRWNKDVFVSKLSKFVLRQGAALPQRPEAEVEVRYPERVTIAKWQPKAKTSPDVFQLAKKAEEQWGAFSTVLLYTIQGDEKKGLLEFEAFMPSYLQGAVRPESAQDCRWLVPGRIVGTPAVNDQCRAQWLVYDQSGTPVHSMNRQLMDGPAVQGDESPIRRQRPQSLPSPVESAVRCDGGLGS